MADLGTDIATPNAADLDPSLGLVSGLRGLGEALARRLVTPRGSLLDDPGYGTDVRSWLNSSLDARRMQLIASLVREELLADERVADAKVTVAFAAPRLTITARVRSSEGPFTLILAVSAVTVDLLRVEAST